MLARNYLLLGCVTLGVMSSPFVLMEQYLDEYLQGMEELKKLSKEYEYFEEDFVASKYNDTAALKDAEEFDFIIVGGGTSGSVIANRLSEVPEWKILLLEAGGEETPITQIPAMTKHLWYSPYSWGHKTVPQKTWCQGMINHQCGIETGKVLGGSSSINSMLFTRGSASDYDHWADNGNTGWCYKDVLPYFKKMEDAHLVIFDRKYHNQGGPLHVENPQHYSHHKDHFMEAALEMHLPVVDYNGEHQFGLGIPQVTTRNGQRNSAAQAYLEPASRRHNLVVKPLSHVIKILISPHTKEATGVKYLHDDKLFVAKAQKEVILAAGAINTPQLLMLSGIGPKEDLEKLKIDVVSDLKVGHNLKDHVAFYGLNYYLEAKAPETKHNPKENLVDYLKNAKGPLTFVPVDFLAFVKTEKAKDKTPDVEIMFIAELYNKGHDQLKSKRYTAETYNSTWLPLEGKEGFTLAIIATHTKSTGTIKLKDKDPLHYPLVDSNQLSDKEEEDINTLVAGIRYAQKLAKSSALQKLGVRINDHRVHGCQEHEFDSDPYWKCAVRHTAASLRHLSGSARMGPSTDHSAVVDNHLSVYGVNKLRVADASVIPVSVSGHLQAPAYMIGEKAADIIKEHWK